MNSKEHIQNTPNQNSKKSNKAKVLLAATAISLAGVVSGQNSATINPRNYQSPSTPFTIPNLPSGSDFYLFVKSGEKIYLTVDGIDSNSGTYFISNQGKRINSNVIELNGTDVGSIVINYKRNGTDEVISLNKHNQVDIYDPKRNHPDAIRVNPNEQAELSAGPNMVYYKWKNVNDASFETGSPSDSIKTKGVGERVVRTNDGSMLSQGLSQARSNDTIDIISRGSVNNNSRSIEFNANDLISGRKYRFYKFNEAQTIGNDSVWTEEPSLAFTANENNHSVPTGVGIWRVGMEDEDGNIVKDDQTQKVTFTTDVLDVSDKTTTFTQKNNILERNEKVEYWIYDISGKIIDSGYNNTATINNKKGVFIVKSKTDDNKNVDIKKIIVQ